MNSPDIVKPTKKQVMMPVIVLVITLVIGGILILFAKNAGKDEESAVIFTAPGTQTISVSRAGEYTIDVAIETTYEGKSYALPEEFTGVKGELTLDGKPVPLEEVVSAVYGKEGERGKTLFIFNAEEAGDYTFTTTVDHFTAEEAILVSRRTDSNNGTIVILVSCAVFIILMGLCQFVAYGVFNLIKWGVYVYHNKH